MKWFKNRVNIVIIVLNLFNKTNLKMEEKPYGFLLRGSFREIIPIMHSFGNSSQLYTALADVTLMPLHELQSSTLHNEKRSKCWPFCLSYGLCWGTTLKCNGHSRKASARRKWCGDHVAKLMKNWSQDRNPYSWPQNLEWAESEPKSPKMDSNSGKGRKATD